MAPTFTQQPQSTSIASGSSVTLQASAAGETGVTITYQWYAGAGGDRTAPLGTACSTCTSKTVTPSVTTKYWVEATNSCGSQSASSTATVTCCADDAAQDSEPQ